MLTAAPDKRSVISAIFFGLFLFIFAEKLLHTHIAADHINKEQAHVAAPSTCALCDFQPGQDPVLLEPETKPAYFICLPAPAARPITVYHDLFIAVHSERGFTPFFPPPFRVEAELGVRNVHQGGVPEHVDVCADAPLRLLDRLLRLG